MAAGVILFTGPTGAGKSLQAERLARKYGWVHLSSGVVLRSSTDPRVVSALESGELVDSSVADDVIRTALRDVASNEVIVFDGFPRRQDEADWFEAQLGQLDRKITRVVVLSIPLEESQRRLQARGRSDDGGAQQAEKWAWYANDVLPVIHGYEKQGLVVQVDGMGTPDEVTSRLEQLFANAH